MPRSLSFAIAVLLASSSQAHAAGFGWKPGLWEIKITKSVVDGVDNTAQISGMADKMRQMMATLPPEQRAQMEARLKQSGVGQASGGGFQICVSPEMARQDRPIVDKDGHCQPSAVVHTGNQTSYTFNCSANGTTTAGKGLATATGNVITTHVDMSIQQANGQSHAMANDTQMTFIAADCGDLKPPNFAAPAAAAPPPAATPPAATPPNPSE